MSRVIENFLTLEKFFNLEKSLRLASVKTQRFALLDSIT
jgi:hypothetical protein